MNFNYTGDPVFDTHIASIAIGAKNKVKSALNDIPDRDEDAAVITITGDDFEISYVGQDKNLKLKIEQLDKHFEETDVWGTVLKEAANQS